MPTSSPRSSRGEAPYQAIWSAPLGDRADLGLMLIGPDMVRLERFRGAFARTELGRRLEPVPELGLVSMTELSEYTPREGSEEHMAMLERRVHPRLPRKRLLCFYPMSKRRDGRRQLVLARLRPAPQADGRPRQARRQVLRAA